MIANSSNCLKIAIQMQPAGLATNTVLKATLVIFLSLINFGIIFGNTLVIAAVWKFRQLRNINCFLITSLAFADLSLGVFVLPFSISLEFLNQIWIFGYTWCQIWLAIDVLLCTASIYNLVAIAIDRYIACSRPLQYRIMLTHTRGKLIILAAWLISFAICLPPMISWPSAATTTSTRSTANAVHNNSTAIIKLAKQYDSSTVSITTANSNNHACLCTPMNNSAGYIIFSAMGSFIIPMLVICFTYVRILKIARQAVHSHETGYLATSGDCAVDSCTSPRIHKGATAARQLSPKHSLPAVGSRASSKRNSKESLSPVSPKQSLSAMHSRRNSHQQPQNDDCNQQPIVRNHTATTTIVSNRNSGWKQRQSSLPVTQLTPRSPSTQNNTAAARHSVISLLIPGLGSSFNHHHLNFMSVIEHSAGLFRKKYSTNSLQRQFSVELRAAKTVAIVTGCFFLCWLGFSVCYILRAFPFCSGKLDCVPAIIFSAVFWLGYVNSAFNPAIYALFNKDFRIAFKRLLHLTSMKHSTSNSNNNNNATVAACAGKCQQYQQPISKMHQLRRQSILQN